MRRSGWEAGWERSGAVNCGCGMCAGQAACGHSNTGGRRVGADGRAGLRAGKLERRQVWAQAGLNAGKLEGAAHRS